MDSDVIKVWNTREGINLEWDICNEEIFSEKYLDQRRVKGKGQLALAGTKMNNTIKQQRRYEHYKVKEKEFRKYI